MAGPVRMLRISTGQAVRLGVDNVEDKILEVGGAGIEGADAKVKALMNNIVNSATPGFRKSDVVIKSFPTYLDEAQQRSSTQVPRIESISYNQTPGTLLRTGNKTDLAIGGDGFFVVETPQGEGYTRDGRFTLDQDGKLVTVAGNFPVNGISGQIVVHPGDEIEFTVDGKVKVNAQEVNTIKVVKFADMSALTPINGSTFKASDRAEMEINQAPRIVSGYVEASNVNIIEEMMNMIYLSRVYGIDSKIVSNREAMMSKAMEMGKPAQ
jgi:flagellar basal body rod protein FlgG